ncbi:MAG: S-layer-like protein y protein [uncultured bacterium]|nr:MAG: S-layer-like protein y protein [uncultured bacterium]
MKRISILLVAVMVLSTIVASAEPFKDVPFSHWSYDAVNKLAAKGILQGYPDGTFKGKQTVTRYALAMVTAKMLANVEQMLETGVGSNLVTKADLQTLEKLTVEFADELALLGVKVTALEDDMQVVKEDVSMLKRDVDGIKDYMAKGGMEKVKLSGDMLVRHTNLTHRNDGLAGLAVASNGNANARTESQIRFKFKANIDENIHAVARWYVFQKNMDGNTFANPGFGNQGSFGRNGIGALTMSDNTIDLAYLHIKDMFRFGGDFTFGRNFYTHGHALLLNDYVDAIRYYKRSGDVDVVFQAIYDRHVGSYNDTSAVDFRNVWNLNLGTKYRDHDLYMGIYAQEEPNLVNRMAPGSFALGNVIAGNQKSDSRWDVEFGSKGPIGNNGHWDYDLGFVYTNYELDVVNTAATAANPWISPEMQSWMGHVAVKWDSKKEWAAKLAYTFADDESMGGIALNNDLRYCDGIETPYEDISRGNNYFRNGLTNLGVLKLQAEFRPRNTKHYFRIAGDLIDELDDNVTNDFAKYQAGHGLNNAYGLAAAAAKGNNTAYDQYNNFGTAEATAAVFTFEYRYQLAENTRIRVGYTAFDFTGDAWKWDGVGSTEAGNGLFNDFDYNMFWSEIYSQF